MHKAIFSVQSYFSLCIGMSFQNHSHCDVFMTAIVIYQMYGGFITQCIEKTSRSYSVSETIYETGQVLLVCEGLDTVSSVRINNKLVGQSDNMFVRYIFDVMSTLKVKYAFIMIYY